METTDETPTAVSSPRSVSRRDVLKASAITGGFLLEFGSAPAWAQARAASRNWPITAWIRISDDDRITLILSQVEIGQGISTTLPAILADELGANWSSVVIEHAPVAAAYKNPDLQWMFTGNSQSLQSFAGVMRKAGAAAREMLVAAAARRWDVPPETCGALDGFVSHAPTNRRIRFGELAEEAAKLPIPAAPKLKADADLKLLGMAIPRIDMPAKVDGSAVFGLDFKVPGMAYAAVRLAPTVGGKVRSVDQSSVRGMPGVIAVVPIPDGVAVVAEHFWQAKTAAEALHITFDDGPNAGLGMKDLMAAYKNAMRSASTRVASRIGDPDRVFATASKVVKAEYFSPFQAHAAMEPMNATASVTAAGARIWAPIQGPDMTMIVAQAVTGLPPEKIDIRWTYCGGGFGRRLLADFVAHALVASKAVGRPAKVVWTREDDMTHDFYRPASLAALSAALDDKGMPQAIKGRLISPSMLQFVYPSGVKENEDQLSSEGLEAPPYPFAHYKLDFHLLKVPVPTSALRTTGFGPNTFALESFIDELAHAAGIDPYQYRRTLLKDNAPALAVLDLAAQRADWGAALPPGRAHGIAFADAFGTLIAQVVELSVAGKSVKLHKVVTAADPGKLFDPGIGASNIEGGVVWGLTSAFKSEVTFEKGRCEQTNFDSYDMVHLYEMPEVVETHFLQSGRKLGGLGEVGPVCIPPAVANALFAATGDRIRTLPLAKAGYTLATSGA